MAWPGGKDGAGVAQRLINEIPPHDVFISPFLGDCAIMRRKRPAALSIGIDLDRENIDRWARTRFDATLELYCCDSIEWLRHRFGQYLVATISVPDRAAVNGGGRSPVAKNGGGRREGIPIGHDAESGGEGLRTFVYCDPPYLLSSRRSRSRLYRHELTDEQHAELLSTLIAAPHDVAIMVSHYPCPMYDQALAGWRSFTFVATTRGGSRVTEKVWCNYAAPAVLHDSSYLGGNKRQREKIRRRRRNLAGKLMRLPPLERQALMDEVAIAGRGM